MVAGRKAHGYTLFEVFLTTALMGMALAFGLTLLQAISDQYALQGATEAVISTLTAGRLGAMTGNQPVRIRVHADRRRYGLAPTDREPALWYVLPQGVEFSRTPGEPLTFYSRGYAAPAGTYSLRNNSGQTSIIVATSGRTRWERTP